MIKINNPEDCCGCTACASICPKEAIAMEPDALGFLYPRVYTEKCVECGLCERVCAFKDDYDKSLNLPQPTAYGARHRDMNEVATSRSGAAFIALSDWVINKGGVVYGVGYKGHFVVTHKRAETKEQRNEFKGSKYVQSDLDGVFRQVKEDLKAGRLVMFSGTGCQTSGLNSYVGKKLRENLILVDIVCHGVPSPRLWKDYVEYRERKEGKKIKHVDFRDKNKFGWKKHVESFVYSDNSYNSYTFTFYQHIMFRKSCNVCHFCNLMRPADVTIADFWGWQKTNPDFNADDKGVSLILVNTEKGQRLFDSVKGDLNCFPAKLENVLQPNLQHPSVPHPRRNRFEEDYARYGFERTMRKYGMMGWRLQLRMMARKVKAWLR